MMTRAATGESLLQSLQAHPDLMLTVPALRQQSRLLLAKGTDDQQRETARLVHGVALRMAGAVPHVGDWAPGLERALAHKNPAVRATAYVAGAALARAGNNPYEGALMGNLVAHAIGQERESDRQTKAVAILADLAPLAKAAEAVLHHLAIGADGPSTRAAALGAIHAAVKGDRHHDPAAAALIAATSLGTERDPTVLKAALGLAWATGMRAPGMARAIAHPDSEVAVTAMRVAAESAQKTPWPPEVARAVRAELLAPQPVRQRAAAASLAALDPSSQAELAASPRAPILAGYLDAVSRGHIPAGAPEIPPVIKRIQQAMTPELAGALLRAAPVIGLPLKDETRARLASLAGQGGTAPTLTRVPASGVPTTAPAQLPTRPRGGGPDRGR